VAAILAAHDGGDGAAEAIGSGTAMDSVEDDARRLLLRGPPEALDVDALATAVGILRARLDDDGAACALSGRLLDLLALLEARPRRGGGDGGASPGSSGGSSTGGGPDETIESAAHGFWGGGDEWSDIRAALMGIGVDVTLDEDDALDLGLEGGGDGGGGVRLDAEAAEQLAYFLSELRQQRSAAGAGAGAGAAGPPQEAPQGRVGAAAAAAEGDAGEGGGEGEGEDALWWEAVTGAYSLLWEEAKAQQAEAE
jgi:hypothetical protein